MSRAPVAGHISSLRAAEQEQKTEQKPVEQEQKKVTLKDASKKHIDPFTGKVNIDDEISWKVFARFNCASFNIVGRAIYKWEDFLFPLTRALKGRGNVFM